MMKQMTERMKISELLSVPGKTSRRGTREMSHLDNEIASLINQGLTDNQIAKQLGISHQYTWTRRTFLKLPSNGHLKKITNEEIIGLHNKGYTCCKIAKLYKMRACAIWVRFIRLGLELNGRKKVRMNLALSSKEIAELYFDKKLSTYAIGEKLGCSRNVIRNRIRELGYELKIEDASLGDIRYAEDSHLCLSSKELAIDNYLHENNIQHEKEPRLPNSKLKADWKTGNIYIEYFGMVDYSKGCNQRIEQKIQFYEENNISHIFIYLKDNYKEKLRGLIK